jgi:hypothetical protein
MEWRIASARGKLKMGTTVEDLLQLAWQSDVEGRPGTRDALLTLAVAEGGVEDIVLAEKCRRLLVARRPGHFFATPAPLSQALDHPQVMETIDKLRKMFPPVRVRHMLMRGAAQRGPFTGGAIAPTLLLLDLAPSPTPPPPHIRPRPEAAVPPPLPFPPPILAEPDDANDPSRLVALYWSVLVAMALLLKTVIEPGTRGDDLGG